MRETIVIALAVLTMGATVVEGCVAPANKSKKGKTATAPTKPKGVTPGTKTATPAQMKPAMPTPPQAPPANVGTNPGSAKADGDNTSIMCSALGLTDGQAFCYYDGSGENYIIACGGSSVYVDWCGNYEPNAETFAPCLNLSGVVDCYPTTLTPVAESVSADPANALDLTTAMTGWATNVKCPDVFDGKGTCDGAAVEFCHAKDIWAYDCSQVYLSFTNCGTNKKGAADCCDTDGACINDP